MFSSGTCTSTPAKVCTSTPAHQQKYAPENAPVAPYTSTATSGVFPTVHQWWMRQKQNQPHFVAVFPLFCKKIKQFAAAIDAVSLYYIIVMGAHFGHIQLAKIQFLYITSMLWVHSVHCTLWKNLLHSVVCSKCAPITIL